MRVQFTFLLTLLFFASNLISCLSNSETPEETVSSTKELDYFKLANRYAKDGLYNEALTHYRKALKNKNKREVVYRNMGIVQIKIGDYRNAVKSLNRTGNRFASDFEFHFYKAEGHRGLKQYDRAIYHYERANEIKPRSLRVEKPLAWSYFKIRYYAKALQLGRKMLRHHRKDIQVHLIVARTLLKTNRINTAEKVIRSAKKYANEIEIAHIKSIEGDILVARNQFKDAARAYRIALKKQPLLPGALHGLGVCLIQDKQIDRGIKYLERAMRIRPDHSETYLSLANAYKLKNRRKYKQYLKQFVKSAANDPEQLEQVQKIKKILK